MATSQSAVTAGSGAESSSNPLETSNDCESQQENQRIELFFTTLQQLRDRIGLLQKHGYHAFNLLDKDKDDSLLDWAATIKEELPSAHVCAHYFLELNRGAGNNEGTDAHVARLRDFLKQAKRQQVDEVLIVSGSHEEKRSGWNTVVALEQLKVQTKLKFLDKVKLAVAFNPYIEDRSVQQKEVERLLQKLDTGIVSKVYLPFGTDLTKLQWALKFLSNKKVPKIAGSLFLPTPLLVAAHKKIRPSNGVVLSQEFLKEPEQASQIVVEMIELYQRYEVEILWESPGVRTEKDVTFVNELMTLKKKEELSFTSGSPVQKRQKTAPRSTNKNTCLLLFGAHDVRLYDNVAVQKACKNHLTVIPVFLWTPSMLESGGIRAEALEVLLRESVKNLQQSLQQFDLPLICRDCPTTEDMKREFQDLLQSTGASAVYFNRDFTPNGRFLELARTRVILDHLPTVQLHGQQSVLLYDVDKVSFSEGGVEGGYWGTLMPFLMSCKQNHGAPRRPIPQEKTDNVLEKARAPHQWPASVAIEDLSLAVLPKNVRPWHGPILKRFPKMSYEGALEVLDEFFQSKNSGFVMYESERSRADKELATSNLSAHLRLGTLSPNTLYWRHEDDPLEYDEKKTFSRRLVWRDLAYFQLRCFPKMSNSPIRAHYEGHTWVTGEEERRRLEAWKWGKTGYPIVDAGKLFSTTSSLYLIGAFVVALIQTLLFFQSLCMCRNERTLAHRMDDTKCPNGSSILFGRVSPCQLGKGLRILPLHIGRCRHCHKCHDVAKCRKVWCRPMEFCCITGIGISGSLWKVHSKMGPGTGEASHSRRCAPTLAGTSQCLGKSRSGVG